MQAKRSASTDKRDQIAWHVTYIFYQTSFGTTHRNIWNKKNNKALASLASPQTVIYKNLHRRKKNGAFNPFLQRATENMCYAQTTLFLREKKKTIENMDHAIWTDD